MKTNIEILHSYGGTVRFMNDTIGRIVSFKCIWTGGEWLREGYGETKERAAGIVVEGLRYIVHHKVCQVENGYET